MLNIIVLLIVGSGLAYIAKFNQQLVTVNLGIYLLENVPLFYVIVGSMLIVLILSYLMQILTNIYTYLELRGKGKIIKLGQAEILDLTKTVHQLELENEKLKHENIEYGDPKAL